jgi:predicted O-methyltransferase YrrM
MTPTSTIAPACTPGICAPVALATSFVATGGSVLADRDYPDVVRRLGRRLVRRLLDSRVGRTFVGVAAIERPDVLLGALGFTISRDARFTQVAWPSSASSFEDVAPLVLSSNPANRGLAAMSLVEVAHLWRLAAAVGDGTIIEIGRERGGSTFVLAAALANRGRLISYDPQGKLGSVDYDVELRAALNHFGFGANVELSLEDSHEVAPPEGTYALVLVDGDPSYEGTRLDFERFGRRLRPGGHVLFHDAVAGGPRHRQLAPLLEEIGRDPEFERRADVGTFAQFARRSG